MISHDQFAKALKRAGIDANDRQIDALMLDLLPNPQSAFSCDGATVWGDSWSIDKVKHWQHNAGNLPYYVTQLRQERERYSRAEELGIVLLNFIMNLSGDNPASIGHVGNACDLLERHGITARDGFYHNDEAAIADAREKFYAAAHPKRSS